MSVIATLKATTAEELEWISGWSHDADLDFSSIAFDGPSSTVRMSFEQEPLDAALPLPQAERLSESWRSTVYRLPFVVCHLTIATATGPPDLGGNDLDEGDTSLLGVHWDPATPAVVAFGGWGPISTPVRHLEVVLQVTDVVARHRKRTVGKLLQIESTTDF